MGTSYYSLCLSLLPEIPPLPRSLSVLIRRTILKVGVGWDFSSPCHFLVEKPSVVTLDGDRELLDLW